MGCREPQFDPRRAFRGCLIRPEHTERRDIGRLDAVSGSAVLVLLLAFEVASLIAEAGTLYFASVVAPGSSYPRSWDELRFSTAVPDADTPQRWARRRVKSRA